MKVAPRTFRVGWDVHAWAGIIAALALYVMFFAGALTLFREEIEGSQEGRSVAERPALDAAFTDVVHERGLVGQRRVALRVHDSAVDVEWTDETGEHAIRRTVAAGPPREARSRMGRFLFDLHFLGFFPKGIQVAGVLAVALGLALVSGIVIQWKDLAAQLFRVRPRRSLRVWSSDLHKVLGVWGAPFQLFFAWSGAVMCLAYVTVWPALAATVFHGDMRAARLASGDLPPPPPPSGDRAPLPALEPLVRAAEARVPGLRARWIGVQHVGDARSSVRVYGDVDGVTLGAAQVLVSARDGAILSVSDPRSSPPVARVTRWMFGLHFARFSAPWRVLYALFALATCAVIATGNIVWLERRDPARERRSSRFLESATVAVCAGLPCAVATLFAANAFLPDLPRRASLELLTFWSVWGVAGVASFMLRARRAVTILTALAGVIAATLACAPASSLRGGFAVSAAAALVVAFRSARSTGRSAPPLLGGRRAQSSEDPRPHPGS